MLNWISDRSDDTGAIFRRRLARLLRCCLPLLLAGCQTASYYSQAIRGQSEILAHREDIPKLIARADTPEPLKEKFQRVLEMRDFARDTLHLPVNGHYLTYVDLHRSHAVWNVYAAPAFSLEPKAWWYPIVGRLTYRGFFSEDDARYYAMQLEREGLVVYVGGVDAYSTLGWFKDPVLNTFIKRSDAELADTLFHELAHQKVFISGDTDFNEAFATAVADEGVRRWLESRGNDAAYRQFLGERQRAEDFVALVMATRKKLETLYASHEHDGNAAPDEGLRQAREDLLAQLRADYATLKTSWGGYAGFDAWMAKPLNNAQFNTVAAYYHLVPGFRRLLEQNGNDLERLYRAVGAMKRMTHDQRRAALNGSS